MLESVELFQVLKNTGVFNIHNYKVEFQFPLIDIIKPENALEESLGILVLQDTKTGNIATSFDQYRYYDHYGFAFTYDDLLFPDEARISSPFQIGEDGGSFKFGFHRNVFLKDEAQLKELEIKWKVYADNMPVRHGTTNIHSIFTNFYKKTKK